MRRLIIGIAICGLAACTPTSSPSGTKGCAAAVDRYAKVLLSDTGTNAEASVTGRASLEACNVTDWVVAADYDGIPLGNTDAHDVLASLCKDEDPSRQTRPCQDSVIKSLG